MTVPYIRNPTYTDYKESVRVASTASVDLENPPTAIDGVTLVYGDNILLKDQGDATQNGIWKWGPESAVLTRAAGSIDNQISSGMLVIVEEGDTQADTMWMLTTDEPIEVDETALTFEQFAPGADLSSYATIAYVDGELSDYLPLAGGTMSGLIQADGGLEGDGAEGGYIYIYNGGDVYVQTTAGGSSAFGMNVDGDTGNRLILTGDGTLNFGSGTGATDSNLYRAGIGVLRSDGKIQSSVAPTLGNDLVNKTYADSKDGGYAAAPAFRHTSHSFVGANDYEDIPDLTLALTGDNVRWIEVEAILPWFSITLPATTTTQITLTIISDSEAQTYADNQWRLRNGEGSSQSISIPLRQTAYIAPFTGTINIKTSLFIPNAVTVSESGGASSLPTYVAPASMVAKWVPAP